MGKNKHGYTGRVIAERADGHGFVIEGEKQRPFYKTKRYTVYSVDCAGLSLPDGVLQGEFDVKSEAIKHMNELHKFPDVAIHWS